VSHSTLARSAQETRILIIVPDDPRTPGAPPGGGPPPIAIRITRPYATEEDFLHHELETLTRTTVILLGAQSRPQGVVLRFEVALSSGQVLVRGEGRVVGFKPNAQDGLAGLTLRFTRLDTRSKALVDRASALREQRKPSTRPPKVDPSTRSSAPPPHPAVTAPAEPPHDRASEPDSAPTSALAPESAPELAPASAPAFAPAPAPAPALAPAPAPAPAPASASAPSPTAAPAGRDSLLDRLRTRAAALDAAAVARILAPRRAENR